MEKTNSTKVRVICKAPVYKKAPYMIPIVKDGERYLTGQDLSVKQMVGLEPLNPEQIKLYPYVIDPTNSYKIRNFTWIDTEDAYGKCLINLMMMSGKWARTKQDFDKNPVRFDGYFEDPIAEVIVRNTIRESRFEAESCIRQAKIEDYNRIALMANFLLPDITIFHNRSKDEVLGQLLDVCETHPNVIKRCFIQYNPDVNKDIFFLECIDKGVIQRKENGDLWHGGEYIGKNLDDVKQFMASQKREHLYAKFQALLDKAKGGTVTNVVENSANADSIPTDIDFIMKAKSAIFDEDLENAKLFTSKINKEKYASDIEVLTQKISELESKRSTSKKDVEMEKFLNELKELTVEELQKKIEHVRSNYKPEECKEFWTDKEELLKYMVKVKFS